MNETMFNFYSLIWIFYLISELGALIKIDDKNPTILKITNMSSNIYWKKYNYVMVQTSGLSKSERWTHRSGNPDIKKSNISTVKNLMLIKMKQIFPVITQLRLSTVYFIFLDWSAFFISHLDEALFIDKYGFSVHLEKK